MRIHITTLLVLILLTSCGEKQGHDDHTGQKAIRRAPDNHIMLTQSQMRLANVTTQRVIKKPVGETIVINGTLRLDQQESEVISVRSSGRIEKLFVKETGQRVRKGEPLYILYSESLLTLQQEYLLAKEQYESLGEKEMRYKSFFNAAEKKLLRYGLTQNQITQLSQNSIRPSITFLSPADGIVSEIRAEEGQYVEEGLQLYNIEDIRFLWAEAELYSNEVGMVNPGDKITVKANGFESQEIEAIVDFISPAYKGNSQILVMRAKIKNQSRQLRPGQQVQIFFIHSQHDAIAIPTDAVIRDTKGTHVYVQSGVNAFQPRMVKTGLEGFEEVEIIEGLNEGDTVAVTGSYLLYSEIVLKKGGDPTAGHQH